jgi:hypothetical protein
MHKAVMNMNSEKTKGEFAKIMTATCARRGFFRKASCRHHTHYEDRIILMSK